MDEKEIKRWRVVAILGTVFMALCLAVSIVQFVAKGGNHNQSVFRYIAIIINAVAFLGFFTQIFAPGNFWLLASVFYIYGIGNFLDHGNILGGLCIIISIFFLTKLGFFYKHKVLKGILFLVLPVAGVVSQIFIVDYVFFLVTVFHFLGLLFLEKVFHTLFYEKMKAGLNHNERMELSQDLCTEDELKILTTLAEGNKYSQIAKQFNISESKLKQRLLELYRILGVKSKTEFLTEYHGCFFSHKN